MVACGLLIGVVLLPAVTAVGPSRGGVAGPSAALLELAGRHGVQPTGDQVDALRALDDLPVPLRDAVGDVVEAFLDYDAAVRTGGAALPVLKARGGFVDAVEVWASTLEAASSASAGTGSPVVVPPAFALDLEGSASVYVEDVALVLDVGGDDVYRNNAGGSNLNGGSCATAAVRGAAAVVDLSGNDAYGDPAAPRSCGANGGGHMGAGTLVDLGGDDVYVAGELGTNGGGSVGGTGLLFDVGGDDSYTSVDIVAGIVCTQGCGVNGGAGSGLGLLLDASGTDAYEDQDPLCPGSGTDRTVVPKCLVGAQVDLDIPLPSPRVRQNPDGSVTVYDDRDGDGVVDPGEEVATTPPQPNPQVLDNPDGSCTVYNDADRDGVVDSGEDVTTMPCPDPKTRQNPDGTITVYDDKNDNDAVDPGEEIATTRVVDPRVRDNPDGSCTVYNDADRDGVVDAGEGVATVPCPSPTARENPDGSVTVYDDKDGDGVVDPGEEIATTPSPSLVDGDGDRIPDTIEDQLCGRPITREFINQNAPTLGECATTLDYVPPNTTVIAFVPTGASPGSDLDDDGVPATVSIQRVKITVDPLADPVVAVDPAPDEVVLLDPDDADPNTPVVSVVTLPQPIVTGVSGGPDADGDGVPGTVTLERSVVTVDRRSPLDPVTLTPTTGETRTVDSDDADPNVPVVSVVRVTVPSGAAPGADADADGFPADVTVEHSDVVFDRRDPSNPTLARNASADVSVGVDGDDADPDNPAPSTVRSPVPVVVGVQPGADADGDDVPASVTLQRGFVVVDRRTPLDPVAFEPAPDQTHAVDPDDADPANPAPSRFGPISLPTGATHSGDGDDDYVPGSVTVQFLNVTVDRTRDDPLIVGEHVETTTLDGDDGNRDAPVPFSVVDADGDLVPDAAEPWICAVQNENDPTDGVCVSPDGSGSDGDGDNYEPPVGAPNPWDLV